MQMDHSVRESSSAGDGGRAKNMTTAASFQIQYSQFIDASGQEVAPLPPSLDDDSLVEFYRDMVFCRAFDKKAVALQRTGRLSTYAPLIGQEAIDVGIARALKPTDVFIPYYRNAGAQILRGVSMVEQFLYFGGNERGCDFKELAEDFPTQINLSTQTPHAVGVAMAIKLRREQRAAVTTIGDGASSKGDFYEAMNLAGVWQVPLVFVAINNGWAISVPYESQTAAKTLAQKAIAAGIESEQVDGNDVVAVHDGMRRALDRARSAEGPYLIDLKTYRLGDHTTADNASRYRADEEVSAAWKKDPIARLRMYLLARSLWDKSQEEAVLEDAGRRIDSAADTYLAIESPRAVEMIDHLFETLPHDLERQREILENL